MRTDEIINSLPPASQNNSREIVRYWKNKFKNCPCDFHKEKLESFGYCLDWQTSDVACDPPEYNNHE